MLELGQGPKIDGDGHGSWSHGRQLWSYASRLTGVGKRDCDALQGKALHLEPKWRDSFHHVALIDPNFNRVALIETT